MWIRSLLAPTRRPCLAALGVATCLSLAVLTTARVAANEASTSPAGSYLAARHAERERDHESAARFLEQALEREPGNFELLLRTHAALVNRGAFGEAVVAAKRIVETSSANAAARTASRRNSSRKPPAKS